MPDAYLIEVSGRTAGIVARDSQNNLRKVLPHGWIQQRDFLGFADRRFHKFPARAIYNPRPGLTAGGQEVWGILSRNREYLSVEEIKDSFNFYSKSFLAAMLDATDWRQVTGP